MKKPVLLGTKGLGELTAVSVAPAIANAVYHATGKRIRDLLITIEKLSDAELEDASTPIDATATRSDGPQTPIHRMHDQERRKTINTLVQILAKSGLLTKDLDYHLIRASMVLIFLAFGYQKWFAYEAQVLISYISNGPLIFWLYPVFGIRGASWFLGVPNGSSAPSFSWDFGTSDWESWELSGRPPRSSGRLRSFRSCRMAGTRLPDFPRWPATFRS